MRRLTTSLTSALALIAALVPAAAPASAQVAPVDRVQGAGRVETAIALSARHFDGGGGTVVVAFAYDYPDALAAAPLAAAADAPVLLNERTTFHPAVRAEVQRLGAERALVMGGPAVQSDGVVAALEGMGLDVERISDPDRPNRYGTAGAAARRAVALWQAAGDGDAGSRVLVALGEHPDPTRAWPDALAAGALGGHAHWPILLTRRNEVPAETNDVLRELGTDHATVVGGSGAVPDSTRDQLAVGTRDRIGGATRYETSTLLADEAIRQGASKATTLAATGSDFPDGLAAAPAAHAAGGVVVLVGGFDLVDSGATKGWLETNRGAIQQVEVVGGTAAVSAETFGQIGFAIRDLQLAVQEVASGFDFPLFATAPPGDARLFVVEKGGRIRTVEDGAITGTFLDLRGQVSTGGEQGLLGLAFHPQYASNGRYWVHYTNTAGDTRVVEYRGTSPVRTLYSLDQPFSNHNGGMIQFGPDGRLYLGLGDGGSGGDPQGHGQSSDPLGSIVRLNVDTGASEVWMVGLRNPWRFDLDATDRQLYIGDVGQSEWEEVDVVAYTSRGTNFGWNIMEGAHCYAASSCDRSGLTLPVLEYPLGGGNCAVTGGFVYRGHDIPELRGQYLYADFCGGWVRGFHFRNGTVSDERDWTSDLGSLGNLPSFGIDGDGELYLTSTNGSVYKIVRGGS